jgi:iron complex outermembrane receptor protein
VRYLTNPVETFAGAPFEGSFAVNEFEQHGHTFSVYTHNTVTEQLDMILGLRWINDEKDGQFAQSDNESQACLNTLSKVVVELLPSVFAPFAVGFACSPFTAPVVTHEEI